jgi:hypothetical protein
LDIYPNSAELFQLLHKAALLQQVHADLRFVPVLVCRRRSFFVWAMAKELGFFPIDVRQQYVLPGGRIGPVAFEEVRRELGYHDLRQHDAQSNRLVEALTAHSPVKPWPTPIAGSYVVRSFLGNLPSCANYREPGDRAAFMEDFRDAASYIDGCDVRW